MFTGNWQSLENISKENYLRLKRLLERTSVLIGLFKGDPDALWITMPLLQLLLEILYTLSFYLLPERDQDADGEKFSFQDQGRINDEKTPILLSPFIQVSTPDDPYMLGQDGQFPEFLLGDGNESWNKWSSSTTLTWVLCSFSQPYWVTHYRLCSANDGRNKDPTLMSLKGLDPITGRWVELHSFLDCPFSRRSEWKTFHLNERSGVFSSIKLEINGARQQGDGVQLGHFHVYGYETGDIGNLVVKDSLASVPQSPKMKQKMRGGKGLGKSNRTKKKKGIPSAFQLPKLASRKPINLSTSEKEDLTNILNTLEIELASSSSTIYSQLIFDGVDSLKTMLINHQKEMIGAVSTVIKGVVKSVIMREMHADLINGVTRCVSAGYDVYRHMSSESKFSMIQQVKYSFRRLSDPVWITYDQVLVSSKALENVNGNWSLSCNYITLLTQAAYLGIKSFASNPEESSRVLMASIRGDGSVIGIDKMLRKAIRHRTPSKCYSNIVTSTLLDGEALAGTLRQVLMEALGELLESVENVDLNRVEVCFQSLNRSTNEDPFRDVDLRVVIDTVKQMEEWKFRFEKSNEKGRKHLRGAIKLLESLEQYLDLFNIALPPEVMELRVRYLLSSSCFVKLTYSGLLTAITTFVEKITSLAVQNQNEVEHVVVMLNYLKIALYDILAELENASSSFSDISFPTKLLESFSVAKERENSDGMFNKGIRFLSKFTSTTPDPATLHFSLLENLPKYLDTFRNLFAQTSSHSARIRYGIELSSRVEDIFFDAVQQHPSELEQSRFLKPNLEMKIRKHMSKAVGKIMNELKNMFQGNLDFGWWNNIADVWKTCAFSEAMGNLRSFLPNLVGPGQCPERVEECALVSFLELESSLDLMCQGIKESHPEILEIEELVRLLELMQQQISQAKALSSNATIRLLLNQEKYREKVKYSLQECWQIIEEDVILSHLESFYSQECLREKIQTNFQRDGLFDKDGFLDVVDAVMSDSSPVDRIDVTNQACDDIVTGKSGISGLGKELQMKLTGLKRNLLSSRLVILEVIQRADRRWGMAISSSCSQDQYALGSYYYNNLPHHNNENTDFYPVYYYGLGHASLPPSRPNNAVNNTGHKAACNMCQCVTCSTCHHSTPIPTEAPPRHHSDDESSQNIPSGPDWNRINELAKPRPASAEPPTPLLYREFGRTNGLLRESFSKAKRFDVSKEVLSNFLFSTPDISL